MWPRVKPYRPVTYSQYLSGEACSKPLDFQQSLSHEGAIDGVRLTNSTLLEKLVNVTTGLPPKCLLTHLNKVVTSEGRLIKLRAVAGSHVRSRL